MGKCAQNTRKVMKGLAREFTPTLLRIAGGAVLKIDRLASSGDSEFWTNHNKRRVALSEILSGAKDQGITSLNESKARLLMELSNYITRKVGILPEDIGDDNPLEDVPETPSLPGGGA